MKRIIEYEIIDHGVEHEQYFQGCGVSHTKYDEVYTGIGDSLKDALNDAMELLASGDVEILGDLAEEVTNANDDLTRTTADENEMQDNFHYASIRVRFGETKE